MDVEVPEPSLKVQEPSVDQKRVELWLANLIVEVKRVELEVTEPRLEGQKPIIAWKGPF